MQLNENFAERAINVIYVLENLRVYRFTCTHIVITRYVVILSDNRNALHLDDKAHVHQ